jgi:hypothetical protein
MDATLAQVVLASPRQRETDAFSPLPIADGEPIHIPSPPVPGCDQRTDDLPVPFGNQEGSRGFGNQALDVIEAVGRACVLAASLCPQVQYCWYVVPSATAYVDFRPSQARSIIAVP